MIKFEIGARPPSPTGFRETHDEPRSVPHRGRFFVGHWGPHAITIAWGEAERSLRVSRTACGAGSYRDFRDDDDSQEPSLWDAGVP